MAPIVVRRTRVVPVPVDVVWQLIESAETLPQWLPLATRVELIGGHGVGRLQRAHGIWHGRPTEIDQRVVEYVEDARIAWTHVEERVAGRTAPVFSTSTTIAVELQAVGASTRVTLQATQVPAGAVAAILLRWTAARRVRRAFDQALSRLASAGA